jgi:hypothetical protein
MGERVRLSNRRQAETIKLRFGGQKAAYHVTVGYYADGRLGEIFISTNQTGSAIEALAHDIAVLMSLGLQHGCSLETMRAALTRNTDGTPTTIAGAVAEKLTHRQA